MKTTILLTAMVLLAVPACTTESMRRTEVANSASLDLRCPASEINVVQVGPQHYVAVGCGQRASFSLRSCTGHTTPAYCKASRSSAIGRHAPGTPLPRRYVPSKKKNPLEDCPALSAAPR